MVVIMIFTKSRLYEIAKQQNMFMNIEMNNSSRHVMFVEDIRNDKLVLRNSWGDYLAQITVAKNDPQIEAFFLVRLKSLKKKGTFGREE
jgi:hypothetical protein